MSWLTLATISALLSAAAAVTQKKVLMRLSALHFSFVVSVAIILLSLFIPFTTDLGVPGATLLIIVGKSLLGGLAFLFVMLALERNQISTALPLLGLTPAVAAILTVLVGGEPLQGWEWAGVALMTVGTYMLEKRPGLGILHPLKDAALLKSHLPIAAALLLFAVSALIDKLLVSGYRTDPLVVLFYQHITYAAMFGGAIALLARFRTGARRTRGERLEVAPEGAHEQGRSDAMEAGGDQARNAWAVLPLILLVAVLTLAYRFTQLEATREAPVPLVLAVKRTSILYASFIGGRLFHDERLRWKLGGAALIVAAGFLILRNVA